MASSATEFLFEVARNDFKEKVYNDVQNGTMDDVPSFIELYSKYAGSELEKKTVADQALRDLVKDKLSNQLKANTSSKVIADMLNIITTSVSVAKQGFCSPSIPFILLGDVLDCFTLSACDIVFQYVEERVGTWKSPLFYTAGKNYLLRMCNDLLRRLSQSKNTVFCGRIQLFLARLFPLSEKSALNLVSQFNLENVTVFNKNPESSTLKGTTESTADGDAMEVDQNESEENKDTDLSSEKRDIVDFKLYQNIWSLQDYFRYPVQCYNKEAWDKFTENADCVFRVFSSYRLEDVCQGHLSHSNTNRTYFSKFLTSDKLTDLQLNDGLFRRQLLVQFLILFRYLTATVKFKGANLVLTEAMKLWLSDAEPKIYNLLKETPPNGKHFAEYTKHLLEREEYWISWKNEGCPSFMKPPNKASQEELTSPAAKKRKIEDQDSRLSIVDEFVAGKNLGMGSPELTRLWNLCPDNLAACQSTSREFLPSLQDYFMECVEQADPKNAIEEQYKLVKNPNFQWKALRLLSHKSQLFFTSQPAASQFKTVPDYLNTIVSKLAKEFPSPLVEENGIKSEEDTEELAQDEDGSKDPSENEDSREEQKGPDDVLEEEEDEMEDEESSILDEAQEEGDQDQSTNAILDALSSDDVTSFATKIGDNWKKLAPHLSLKPKDIKEIEDDSDDAVLQARQALVTWQDSQGKKATWSCLVEALTSADLGEIAKD